MAEQITQLPTSAPAPVLNIKARGHKKGTISFSKERQKRLVAKLEVNTLEPEMVELPPVIEGKFFYPAKMLWQAYFCRNGYGQWFEPKMDLHMLTAAKFVSPMGALLDQLEAEGHDVGGARAEWLAFRELTGALEEQTEALEAMARRIMRKKSLAAIAARDTQPPT